MRRLRAQPVGSPVADVLTSPHGLLAMVAHDLRSPLASIQINAESLLRRRGEASLHRQRVKGIQEAARRMDRLVDDLLDYARFESGCIPLDRRSESPSLLIDDALAIFSPIAARRSVELRVEAPRGLPRILADRRRVVQVLSNLLDNAIKFTPAGGAVTIALSASLRSVRFAVRNDGAGVPSSDLLRIFHPFWQGANHRGGTGLGLAIAKAMIEAHRGKISAERGVSGGTDLIFTIPRATPVRSATRCGATAGALGRRRGSTR